MNGASEVTSIDKYFSARKNKVQLVKSTENWELWLEQTRQIYYSKYPDKKDDVDKFIGFVDANLGKYRRSFIPRKVIWYLWGKRNWVINNNQHFWIAIIGKKGGEGKSTLAEYISMILDPTYTKSRCEQDYDRWLAIIPKAKKETQYPAIILDEPDNETHDLSKKGRQRKDILERIRILHLFVCVCANSLSSVPQSIYERLSAVVFINNDHKFWVWDSTKDKPRETVVEDIKGKDGWGKHRHAVFRNQEFVRRACFKNLRFTPPDFSPFNEKSYERKKEEDVLGLIGSYKSKTEEKSRLDGTKDRLTEDILTLKRRYPVLTDGQIGMRLGISREWVNTLRNKAVKREAGQL